MQEIIVMGHCKYPEAVRLQIARSGNPYLFPELRVPRTTANYWIKKVNEISEPRESGEVFEKRLDTLTRKLKAAESLNELVRRARILHPDSFKQSQVKSKPIRRHIVEAVREASKLNLISECLKLIGLSQSTYSRWLSEFFLCESIEKICHQRRPHQLTLDELKTMRRLVTSKKYSHLSVVLLCLWAQRKGALICSVDSWYKYLKIFGWSRPRKPKVKKPDHSGIRTSRPNEIWHIDVTQVKTVDRKIVYVQAIYDNFSRFVLAWRTTSNISAVNTVELIEAAKRKASELDGESAVAIMSDGGPENNNLRVLNLLTSASMRQLIARVDVRFSNSMVESLFRMLKTNFVSGQSLRNLEDVERKVGFFYHEHNSVIPKIQIKGATPLEMYTEMWTQADVEQLRAEIRRAAAARRASHREFSCASCVS